MMKLFSQLEHVERATPLARRDDGKISGLQLGFFLEDERRQGLPDGMAHPTGPQLAPNEIM